MTVHPTSLYEAAAYTLVCGALFALRKRSGRGMLFGAFLVLTSVARFAIEFWRVNPSIALGLSEAQLVASGTLPWARALASAGIADGVRSPGRLAGSTEIANGSPGRTAG